MSAGDGARYRRAAERVHRLGAVITTRLLIDAGVGLGTVLAYADLDRYPEGSLAALGADAWAPDLFAVSSS